MNTFAKKRVARTSGSLAFQLSPVAAGCAVFIAVMGGNVYAQETVVAQPATTAAPVATTETDAVVAPGVATVRVTGIRQGIEAAISIKKNSSSIVEAISAEDIGKLPDQSVAESISRLPGVSMQRGRSSGKASDISVRGLSPSFNGTLLNGREMASTGNARSPEFDLFPAELMGSVVIYKTPDASVIGQGLASTIDLRTVQPLDFGKRTVAVSYKKSQLGVKQRNGLPEGDGDRYTLSYVDQFADRTIGVALGFTRYEELGGGQAKFNSWGTAEMDYKGAKVKTPGGFGYDTEVSSHNRDGAFASLQFRPNKNFKSSVDLFYSAGETGLKKTGFEGGVAYNAGGAYERQHVLSTATVANGVATSGTLTDWKGVVRNHYEGSEDDLKSIGWNSEFKFGDWITAADLTWSKATKLSSRYETYAGLAGRAQDTLSYTGFDGGNVTQVKYTPGMNYSDRSVARLTDVMGWSGGEKSPQAGYLAQPFIEDEVKAIRLTAKKSMEWGPLVGSTYGFNYTARDKARTGDEGRLLIKGSADPYAAVAMPGSDVAQAGASGFSVASWDPRGSLGSIYELAGKVDADILSKYWDVQERITTAYVMGDLDGELFGLSYRGNVGLQAVHTDQTGGGYVVDKARCVGNTAATCPAQRVSEGDKYWDVLPSLNLSFDLKNDQMLRFGLAKVVSRANLDDLRAGQNFGLATNGVSILTGGGGNPQLKPFRAKAIDLSYEKYFGKKGYISAAVFYKKLDTYIFRAPRVFDYAPFVTPATPLPLTGPYAGSTMGLFTQPINGDGGSLRGFELAVNLPLSMFTPYLDGFGVMANHSDTKSGIELPESGFSNVNGDSITIPLPGLSRKVSNLRLYYEKAGFQIAAAARKRSSFLGQVSDYQDNQQLTFIKGETIVDLQASYEFQSGWLKGLSVYAQAQNWNNAPFLEYTTDENNPSNRVDYGRTYHFGASYKF
ncbi:MAG TPA: TonB-dependent receptor [Telluria sp.]